MIGLLLIVAGLVTLFGTIGVCIALVVNRRMDR